MADRHGDFLLQVPQNDIAPGIGEVYNHQWNTFRKLFGMETLIKLRIACDDGKILFGPGSEELFGYIRETGSVSRAAQKMGLSLSKAWKIVRDTEDAYGAPLVICTQGGKGGGRSKLTEDAETLMARYSELRKSVEEAARARLEEIFR